MRSSERALVLLGLCVGLGSALAQEPSREREAMRRAQQQASRLQQDNAVLQREKLELQQKLKEAENALKAAQGEAARLRRASKALQAAEKDKQDLQAKLAQTERQSAQASQSLQAQISGLRSELDGARIAHEATKRDHAQAAAGLEDELTGATDRANACEQKNTQLYSVTLDLIDRYKENRGAWERFLLSEPFTGLKSVEVENLLDDVRSKAKENKIVPSAAAKPAARAAAGSGRPGFPPGPR